MKWLRAEAPKFGQHFLSVDDILTKTVEDTREEYACFSGNAARLYEECVVAAAQMPMGLRGRGDFAFLHDAGASSLRWVCSCMKALRDHVAELASISTVGEEGQEGVATHRHAANLDTMIDELLVACARLRATDKYKYVRAQNWPRDSELCQQLVEARKSELAERSYRAFVSEWLAAGQVARVKRLSAPALRVLAERAGLAREDVDWISVALQDFVCAWGYIPAPPHYFPALPCLTLCHLVTVFVQCFRRHSSGHRRCRTHGRGGSLSTFPCLVKSFCANPVCWPAFRS